jgi:hypothetical protein
MRSTHTREVKLKASPNGATDNSQGREPLESCAEYNE